MLFSDPIKPGRYETYGGKIIVVEKVFGRGRNRQAKLRTSRMSVQYVKVSRLRNIIARRLES